jgi:hypothetical protein
LDGEVALGKLHLEGLAGGDGFGLGNELVGFVAHQGIAPLDHGVGVKGHQVAAQGLGAIASLAKLHLYALGEAAFELLEMADLLLHPLVEAYP